MRRSIVVIVAVIVLVVVAFGGQTVRAAWPDRVFAPYIYGSRGALIEAYNATGQKYFSLAFTTSNRNRRGGGAATRPTTQPIGGGPAFPGHLMSEPFFGGKNSFFPA